MNVLKFEKYLNYYQVLKLKQLYACSTVFRSGFAPFHWIVLKIDTDQRRCV